MSRLIADGDYGVNELGKMCLKSAEERGFLHPDFSEMIALLHSEVSEAYEEYRNNRKFTEIYYNENKLLEYVEGCPKPEGIPMEFADIAIRLFHYCAFLGIDLAEAIKEKYEYNGTRPYRHGNKKT